MSLLRESLIVLLLTFINAVSTEPCTYGRHDIRDLKRIVCEMFPEFRWFNCQEESGRAVSNPIRDYCEQAQNDPICCIVFGDLPQCYVSTTAAPTAFISKHFCQRYPYHSICQFKPTAVPPHPVTADPKIAFCNTYPNFYLPECKNYYTTTQVYETDPISGKPCQCVPRWKCRSNDISDLARLSQCNDHSTICCPLEYLITDPQTRLSCGVKGNKDGNQISVSRFARILDSNFADFGEYPWQAAVLFSNFTYNCGGVLVHPQYVATAAHCVKSITADNIIIRIGEYDTETDAEPPYQEYGVQSITIHPAFNKETLANDLALLRLTQSAELNNYINIVCLSADIDFTGKNCTVTGWGRDSPKGYFSSVLKEVDVPVVSNSYCQHQYRLSELGPYYNLDNSFLCAGSRMKDACEGDGGSPLVCEVNGIYHLAGVVSWGIGCGGDYPGVYVKIPNFVPWMEKIIYNKTPY